MRPKAWLGRTKGTGGFPVHFLTQSRWGTWSPPSYCCLGDSSNPSGLLHRIRGQRAEKVQGKLPQWGSERVSRGRREVKGSEGVVLPLSLKLRGCIPGGCLGLQHRVPTKYLRDPVVTVSVKSTSCVRSTIRSTPGSWLLSPYRIPHRTSCSSSRAPQLRGGVPPKPEPSLPSPSSHRSAGPPA